MRIYYNNLNAGHVTVLDQKLQHNNALGVCYAIITIKFWTCELEIFDVIIIILH